MNAYLPALIAQHFRDSRIAVFSSGNVYPLMPLASGGATEETAPAPVGEYAQSVLGARTDVRAFFPAVMKLRLRCCASITPLTFATASCLISPEKSSKGEA